MKRSLVFIVCFVFVSLMLSSCTKKYTIVFDSSGGSIVETQEVKKGKYSVEPDIPTKEGYSFVKWLNEDKDFDFSQKINKDYTLTALWQPIEYSVIFIDGNTVIDTVSYTVENKNIVEPVTPLKEGYISAWEDYVLDIGNKTVSVVYTPADYYVKFIADGVEVQTLGYSVENNDIIPPQVPEKEHYVGKWEEYTLNGGNKVVHAVYTPIIYTITFRFEDTTDQQLNYTIEDIEVVEPVVPEKEHYVGKWEEYTLNGGNKVVNVIYTPVEYKVELNLDNNSDNQYLYVTYNQLVQKPVNPTKAGYIFDYWKCEESIWNFDENVVTKNMTLKAIYRDVTEDYIFENDTITKYVGTQSEIVIPSIYISNSEYVDVKKIAPSAFLDCVSITSVDIPTTIEEIGYGAFKGCNNLQNITVPFLGLSKNDINNRYFSYIFGSAKGSESQNIVPNTLENVTVLQASGDDKVIGFNAFMSCSYIKNIVLPDDVEIIGSGAFNNCFSLININISSRLREISGLSFSGCSELKTVTLPNTIEYLGADAFMGCRQLKTVYYDGNIEDWCNIEIVNEKSNPAVNADEFYIKNENNEYAEVFDLIIPETITSIGIYQFTGFYKVINVVVPDSVTSIGTNAFKDFKNVERMTLPFVSVYKTSNKTFGELFGALYYEHSDVIPSTLKEVVITNTTTIVDKAFYNCKWITKITLPETVTSIGNSAFKGCTFLENINIPTNVESIGEMAFLDCTHLKSIEIKAPLKVLESSVFSGCHYMESIILPDTIEVISTSAFKNCANLTSITLPNSLVTIESSTFNGCSSLTEIIIPDSVTSLGESCFDGCSSLNEMILPTNIEIIPEKLFYNCSNLKKVVIKDLVHTIGSSAFYGCVSLEEIILPNSLKNIGENQFNQCTNMKYNEFDNALYLGTVDNPYFLLVKAKDQNITECNINENTKMVLDDAFFECTLLEEVNIPNSVEMFGEKTFYNCSSLNNVVIPASVKELSKDMFWGCSSLDNISLQEGLLKIGNYAFNACAFESIYIPSTVNELGDGVFQSCKNLKNVNIPENVTILNNGLFNENDSLETVYIPNSIITIIGSLFNNCKNLKEIYIPSSVTEIYNSLLKRTYGVAVYCEVETQPVDWPFSWNEGISTVYWGISKDEVIEVDGSHYILDDSTLTATLTKYISNATELTIPSTIAFNEITYNVEKIGAGAFNNNQSLTKISMTDSIIEIGSNAFANCLKLQEVVLSNNITELSQQMFANATSLINVIIPENVINIDSHAFYGCRSLETIILPNKLENIGAVAFSGCESLQEIVIPDSVQTLGEKAFIDCIALESVIIGKNLKTIPQYAFYENTNLIYLDLGQGVETIGYKSFDCCPNIEEIIIPNSVKIIEQYAFNGTKNLTKLIIGSQVEEIKYKAFLIPSSLSTVIIPASVKIIESGALSYSFGTVFYTEAESKPDGWSYDFAYYGINDDNFITLSEMEYVLDLENNTAILSQYLGNSEIVNIASSIEYNEQIYIVKEIGRKAFAESHTTKEIFFAEDTQLEIIGANAFSSVYNLETISIPKTVTTIKAEAFSNDKNISKLVIPINVTIIEKYICQNNNIPIYCEATSKPEGWDELWVPTSMLSRYVTWGYTE